MNKLLQYMIGAGNVSDKFLPNLPKAQVGFNGLPIDMTRYSASQDNTRRVSPQQTARDLNNAAALNKFRMEQAERKRQLALRNKGQSDLSNFFADMGTGMLSLANPLNPFADSVSPFPTQKQLEAGRSGDWMKRSGLIADATTNAVSGILTDGLLNAAAPIMIKGVKSAGRVVGNVLRPSPLDLTNPNLLNTRLDDLYQKNNFNISFKDKTKEIVNKLVDAKLPLGPKKRILPDNMNLVSRTHRGIDSSDMLRVQAVDDTGNIWGSLYARPYYNDNSDYLINGIRKSVQEVKDNSGSIFRLENGLRVNDIKKAKDWLKPGMISVEPALQGNRLQDVLYEQLIRDGKLAGFKGIRSGDNLLSPAKTAKAHERFNKQIFETKNTSGVNHYVSGLTGHKNPNVIQEWLDNYQNIDKYKRNTISLRDVYNTANNAGRFVRNNPKDVAIGVGLAGASAAGAYGTIQGTNAFIDKYKKRYQYRDKKKNGGWLNTFQDGGKKTSILAPEIKYMEEYLNSPMYLERLAKMAATEKQLQDFDSYNKRFSSEQFSHSKITDPLKNVAAKQAKNTKDALNYIKNNVFIGDYDFGNIVPGATIAGVYDSGVKDIRLRKDLFEENPTVGIHELSHATLQGQDPYTTDFHKKYLDPILLEPGSVGWHPIVQVPTEIKARLDSVRYLAKKKGLYDAGKERFTEKHLRMLENDPEIKKDFNFKQLKDQLKPGTKSTGFIWMMNNIAKLQDEKSNYLPLAKDGKVITDPRGQWAHPGKVTRIPSPNITMQGVNYPVFGVGSNGQEQMMYPEQEYDFGNASYVDEYPIMQFGGGTLLGPSPMISKIAPKIVNMFSGNPLKKFINWANEKDNAEAVASISKPSPLPVEAPVRTYNWSDTHHEYRDRANKVYSELHDNDAKEYNSPKKISLSSGRFAGAKVDPEMINDIVNAAKVNNIDPWVMLSLVGRESTFGSGTYENRFRADNKQMLVSGWNVAEDFMPYEFNRFLADKQVPGIKVHKDNHGWSYKVEDEKVVDEYLKKNPQLIDNYYKKLESTPDLGGLDSFALAAQRIKKKGIQNYNPGDPKYLSMVNEDMNLLKQDAALKAYMKTKGYRYGGGLLSKTVSCSNCGWSWKAVEGGIDPLNCHKCGGVVKMKNGGQHGKQPLEKKHGIKVTYKK